MKFVIIRGENVMSVDNEVATINAAGLAANVLLVAWDGNTGVLQYNDRAAIKEPFGDPSPYQTQLNLWIAAKTAALTLTQSKAVKTLLVDGIYRFKRTAPITYSGQVWDASDEAFSAMLGAAVGGSSGLLAAITLLADETRTATFGLYDDLNVGFNHISIDLAEASSKFTFANHHFGELDVGGTTGFGWTAAQTGLSFPGGVNPPGGPYTITAPSGGGSVSWLPAGSTTPVTVDLNGLIAAIVARRNAAQLTRSTKAAQIAALASTAAVITYDATTGW
jgi:hypothetical protein